MDVILILGAAVWQDGPSPALARRCKCGLALWRRDPAQVIIPCGGTGIHPPAEAHLMRDMLIAQGVPSAKILLEDQSRTTYENIRNAHALLRDVSVDRMTIVTDLYHLPRARLVARHFGYHAKGCAPSLRGSHVPTQSRAVLREVGATPLYALKLLRHRWRGDDRP